MTFTTFEIHVLKDGSRHLTVPISDAADHTDARIHFEDLCERYPAADGFTVSLWRETTQREILDTRLRAAASPATSPHA